MMMMLIMNLISYSIHMCVLYVCVCYWWTRKFFLFHFRPLYSFFCIFFLFHMCFIYILWMDNIIYLMYVKKLIWCLCVFCISQKKKNRCCISNFYIHMYRWICLSYTCTPRYENDDVGGGGQNFLFSFFMFTKYSQFFCSLNIFLSSFWILLFFFLVSGFLSSSSSFDYNIGRHKKIYMTVSNEIFFFCLFLVHTPCFCCCWWFVDQISPHQTKPQKNMSCFLFSLSIFFCNGGERGR